MTEIRRLALLSMLTFHLGCSGPPPVAEPTSRSGGADAAAGTVAHGSAAEETATPVNAATTAPGEDAPVALAPAPDALSGYGVVERACVARFDPDDLKAVESVTAKKLARGERWACLVVTATFDEEEEEEEEEEVSGDDDSPRVGTTDGVFLVAVVEKAPSGDLALVGTASYPYESVYHGEANETSHDVGFELVRIGPDDEAVELTVKESTEHGEYTQSTESRYLLYAGLGMNLTEILAIQSSGSSDVGLEESSTADYTVLDQKTDGKYDISVSVYAQSRSSDFEEGGGDDESNSSLDETVYQWNGTTYAPADSKS